MDAADTSARPRFSCPRRLDQLFQQHKRALLRMVSRIIGCRQTAEDVIQEVSIRVTEAARKRTIAYLQPFLYQTAKNVAVDYLRKEQVRRRTVVENAEERIVRTVPSLVPSPETVVADRQEVERLGRVIAELPERRRQILVLHKFYGWRYEEIAAHLGISESAVEKNVRAAMAHCLAKMEEKTQH